MGVGGSDIRGRVRLAGYAYSIPRSSQPRASERVCCWLADGINRCETIKGWFDRCRPKNPSSAGQAGPDPSAEIAEAFVNGNSRITPKAKRTDAVDPGSR